MVTKIIINDPVQRMSIIACLAESGYMVWTETQIGKVLFKPDNFVCFCDKSDATLKLH